MTQDGTAIADQGEAAGTGVLRRMLLARTQAATGQGRAPQMPRPDPPTPSRAAATAVGRAADRLYHLGVQPISVVPGALTLAELPELLPSPALLAVLQGPGDLVGAMALCPQTVTALIEIQTLGRITSRVAEPRRPTRSDAMICADFINALMADLAVEMAGIEGFEGIAGYRYASYLDDPRPLALMLEDKPYRSIRFDLRLGGTETREATIFLALPHPAAHERPVPAKTEVVQPAKKDRPADRTATRPVPAQEKPALGKVVDAAPIELIGVLCRRRMTLGELRGLAEGKLLHLPRVSLSEARIETRAGQLLAVGKFGEAEGCHAIRLRDPASVAAPDRAGAEQPDAPKVGLGKAMQPAARPAGHEPPIDDLDRPDLFRRDDAADVSGQGQTMPQPVSAASKASGGG